MRHRLSDRDFLTEVLAIIEINADERIVASVAFDLDDFDSAIAELAARYLAGEAAAHPRTWSAIAEAYAALKRHEPSRRRRTGHTLTIGRSPVSRPMIWPHYSVPHGNSRRKAACTSRPCIR